MSCKFKRVHDGCTRPYCYVTNGECQFIVSPYDDNCSILNAYKDLVPKVREERDETAEEQSSVVLAKRATFADKVKT